MNEPHCPVCCYTRLDALGLSSGGVEGQKSDGVRSLRHTPGPWTLDAFPVLDGSWRVRAEGKIRAIVPSRDSDIVYGDLPEGHCNALLIAAAPDLVEMLNRVLRSAVPNERDHPTMFKAWKEAQALIDSLPQSANAVSSKLGRLPMGAPAEKEI